METTQNASANNTCGEIRNLQYPRSDLGLFIHARDQGIVDAIDAVNTARELIARHPSLPDAVASDLLQEHMTAVSAKGGNMVVESLQAGATLPAAVRAGVGASDILEFVNMIAELFKKLMEDEKKCIGLIVNDTDHDIEVTNWKLGFDDEDPSSGLYLPHGRMEEFMHDNTVSPAVQIKKRSGGYAYCGLYLMTKRDCALVGAECTMRLTLKGGGPVIDYLSCCPYTQDNRVNLAVNSSAALSEVHETLYRDKQKEVVKTAGTITATARVNSYTGSPSYCILSLVQSDASTNETAG